MWAITITLKPKMYRYTLAEQHAHASEEILKLRKYCSMSIIAEITKACNIHYHGVIKMHDSTLTAMRGSVQCFVTDAFRKSQVIGYVNLREYTDRGWVMYVVKDTAKTILDLKEHPVICDDLDMLKANLTDFGILRSNTSSIQ